MTLVERIQELCDKKGTTLIGLERILNFGRGTIRKWDKSSPSIDKLGAVADYFNVSIDYLRTGNNPDQEFEDDIRAIARNMKNISKDNRKLLGDLVKSMKDAADGELKK